VSRLSSGSFYSFLPALDHREAGAGLRREALSPCGWTGEKVAGIQPVAGRAIGAGFKGIEEENPPVTSALISVFSSWRAFLACQRALARLGVVKQVVLNPGESVPRPRLMTIIFWPCPR